jgi:hypothetical protein
VEFMDIENIHAMRQSLDKVCPGKEVGRNTDSVGPKIMSEHRTQRSVQRLAVPVGS